MFWPFGKREKRRGRVHQYTASRPLSAPERLERREVLTVPYGAIANDTAEFFLGDIVVSVVFMESDGSIDQNRENWTPQLTQQVKQKIETGMNWWRETLDKSFPGNKAPLNFIFDYTYADTPVRTGLEPISRPSDDFSRWINDFFNESGYNQTSDFSLNIKAFNHAQRKAYDADWAFTIFVVNDTNDPDHQFHPSGTFDRSFAYAGGRFQVVLASRPASTTSHEAGHIFWAYDEYFGGATWSNRRGYLNTQNTNAADNPTLGFRQADSIMSSGEKLDNAYRDNTSPTATFELLGWRDSDGNGIFDILDVPFALSGVGYYDAPSGNYRFQGRSAVRTLPNLNSDSTSLKNDITINEIGRAEYRIDGGPWQTAAAYRSYEVNLDLTFPVPADASTVEIRTLDPRTTVTSPIFVGTTSRPVATASAGINGFVWKDIDSDGQFTSSERGVAGRTVRIVDAQGNSVSLQRNLEPDDYPSGTNVGNILPDVTLSAIGSNSFSSAVTARTSQIASTGTRVFSNNNTQDSWSQNRQLRISFATPVTEIRLDAIGNGPGIDYGRIEIYDSNDRLLARHTTAQLQSGDRETMILSDGSGRIAYALAYGHATSGVLLDNLRIGPESVTVTDAHGRFSLPNLPAGTYQVEILPESGWSATNATTKTVILTAGQVETNVDFGQIAAAAPWQNPVNRFDVNNDGTIAPIDVLIIINDINTRGSRSLAAPNALSGPPPFLDVSGDNFISPIDALSIIDRINNPGSGEASGSRAMNNAAEQSSDQSLPLPEGEGASAADRTTEPAKPDSALQQTDEIFAGWPSTAAPLPLASAARRRPLFESDV